MWHETLVALSIHKQENHCQERRAADSSRQGNGQGDAHRLRAVDGRRPISLTTSTKVILLRRVDEILDGWDM